MKKITSKIFITILSVLILTAVCFALIPSDGAYAEESLTIKTQPSAINTVYNGKNHTLTVELSNSYAIATYSWYKRENANSLAVKVAEGQDKSPSISLKNVSESGYYFCEITKYSIAGVYYNVDLTSNLVSVVIFPKQIEVTKEQITLVYNGEWQRPVLSVKSSDLIEGDTVSAEFIAEKSTKNAGSYPGKLQLTNDNYAIDGEADVTFVIKKAELTIQVKEVGVRAGFNYELEFEYIGLVGEDTVDSLGFLPTITSDSQNITSAGVYDVKCSGLSETENYVITYKTSKLYVNEGILSSSDISGITATAAGSFRNGTHLSVTKGITELEGFNMFKTVYASYSFDFVSGGSDGDNYIVNIVDENVPAFMLSVCVADENGVTSKISSYSYDAEEKVISITLPSDFSGSVIIYHNYTVLVILGAVLLVVFFITFIVILSSRRKYKNHLFYYQVAEREANKYR